MAIGSGGLKGKGFLQGTMTNLNYVPEQSTDFIFSTVGEEQGFIGALSVIILYLLLIPYFHSLVINIFILILSKSTSVPLSKSFFNSIEFANVSDFI